MTSEVLLKLEDAFSISATDKEACFYAGISPTTLYSYQEKNPEFAERKEALKNKPNLKARQTIVQQLDDVRVAEWWLEKKRPDEFGQRQRLEHFGKLQTEDLIEFGSVSQDQCIQLAVEYEDKLKALIVSNGKNRPATNP